MGESERERSFKHWHGYLIILTEQFTYKQASRTRETGDIDEWPLSLPCVDNIPEQMFLSVVGCEH